MCISHALPSSQKNEFEKFHAVTFSFEQVPVDRVAKFGRPSNNKMFLVSKKVEESPSKHAVEGVDTSLEMIPPTQVYNVPEAFCIKERSCIVA